MEKIEKLPKSFLGIPIALFLFGLASLFTDVSTEMITPILPFFIAALGGSMEIIGLIGGLSDALASILKLLSGYLSDKFHKKKPFIFWGYATSAISKYLLLFASTWVFVLLQRVLDRIGKGFRDAPRDAYISVLTKAQRGKIFGIHKVMDNLGAVLGVSISIIIVVYFSFDYLLIFALAVVFALISLIPLLFVEDLPHTNKKEFKITIRDLDMNMIKILIIFGIFGLANFTYMIFIMKAQTILGNTNIVLVMMLYLIASIATVVLTYPAGLLYDVIGKYAIILGFVLFAITVIGFVYAQGFYVFIILFILYGISIAFVEGNARAFISDISKKELRGTMLGAYYFVIGLVALPAGWLAGYFWEVVSPNAPFIFSFCLTILAIILFLIFSRFPTLKLTFKDLELRN